MRRSLSVAGRSSSLRVRLPAVAVAKMDALGSFDGLSARLQPRDSARLAAMATGKRRRELLAGRCLLHALAVHCALPAVTFDSAEGAAGVVVRSETGAPVALSASVSHAGHWIACAIGDAEAVGVDLELLTGRDFIAFAETVFPEDVASLATLAPEARSVAFYRRWTRYEAALKRGGRPGRYASWLLPGEWVLSVQVDAVERPIAPPLLWDEHTREFRALALETLP